MKTGVYQGLDLHKDTTEISEVCSAHIFHICDTEVDKFLSRHSTFRVRNFTCEPDQARKIWVIKTKVYVRSRHN